MKDKILDKLKTLKKEQRSIISAIRENEEHNLDCDRLYIICAESKGMIFSLEWVLELLK